MSVTDPAHCTNCRQLQARGDAWEAELAALKGVVAQLGQQLAAARKDSSTSSRPPWSDIVKPPRPPPEGRDRRRIGGQPGHPKHGRAASPAESINGGSFDHRPDSGRSCGRDLRPMRTVPPRVVQRVAVVEVPPSLQEHRSHPGWCPHRQEVHEAPLPPGIARGGLVGPSLTTLIASLEGACHASHSTARKSVRDVVGGTTWRGEPARIIAKLGRAPERPCQEWLDDRPGPARPNGAETGHRRDGDRQWAWCSRAGLYTPFPIDPTRGADVLIEVLGAELDGVLGCDYFSSCRRYRREFGVLLQSCLAHLIRAVKYLTTPPDARDRGHGEGRREALRSMFAVIHRREGRCAPAFQGRLEAARAEVMGRGTQEVPETRPSGDLAKRSEAHGESHVRFVTTPGAEPTNNPAEPAIRFVVIDRLIRRGARSEAGERWCERIWAAIARCVRQGRPAFAYLGAAVGAWFDGAEAPTLLPGG